MSEAKEAPISSHIYRSPRRHSNSSKTFWKSKMIEINFMTISELAESLKTKNRPGPARPDPVPPWRSLTAFFSESMKDKWTDSAPPWRSLTAYFSESIKDRNFQTTFILVFNLCSLIVLKLCGFRQRSNFGTFQQFFHHNFRLKMEIMNSDDPIEKISSDLSEYTLFQLK